MHWPQAQESLARLNDAQRAQQLQEERGRSAALHKRCAGLEAALGAAQACAGELRSRITSLTAENRNLAARAGKAEAACKTQQEQLRSAHAQAARTATAAERLGAEAAAAAAAKSGVERQAQALLAQAAELAGTAAAERAAAEQLQASAEAEGGERGAQIAALQDQLAAVQACSHQLQKQLDEEREAEHVRRADAEAEFTRLQTVMDGERAAAAEERRESDAHTAALNDSLAAAQARADGLQKLFDYAQSEVAAYADNTSAEQVSVHAHRPSYLQHVAMMLFERYGCCSRVG